jgi:hypothetical protein
MDIPIFILKVLPFFGSPVVVGIAWWKWSRRARLAPWGWRAVALFVALVSVSANGVMFYCWVLYRTVAGEWPDAWRVNYVLGNYFALCFVLAGLTGSILGKGPARFLVGLLAIMGFMLWVPVAIL